MTLSHNKYLLRILHCSIFIFIIGITLQVISSKANAAKIEPGFRTESLWLPKEQTKIDLAIWYPTLKKPASINYGDWDIIVAQNAKPIPGKYPIIILSHDSIGSRFSYHHIASHLVKKGFVIIAPTHQGDNIDDMKLIFTLEQMNIRIRQLNTVIDFVLKDKELSEIINKQQIGLLGIGVGGTVGLLLAGATLDSTGWNDYCNKVELSYTDKLSTDTYCSSWTKQKMDILVKNIHPQQNYLNPKISAVISIAPSFGMLFSKKSLASLKRPVLLVELEKDTINIPQYHSQHIIQQLSTSHRVLLLHNTSPEMLIAPCTENLKHTLPEICSKQSDKQKKIIYKNFINIIPQFLLKNFTEPIVTSK